MARETRDDLTKSASQWRGKSKSAPPADRGWQKERAFNGVRPTQRRALWRRVRVALLLLGGVFGGAGLLAVLMHREVQPPFIAVVKTAYRAPFAPNSWAQEDVEAMRIGAGRLDGKTIDVIDYSDADRKPHNLLLPSAIDHRQLLGQARNMGVIFFYLSMHGLVDDSGRPCFATTEANAVDASTWLPLAEVLRQIKDWGLPDSVHKLLLIDANREADNWPAGVIDNSFASRLEKALHETPVPNLVILNSTSYGQNGWAAPELQGTVFGQFLRLGLAGAADLPEENGNHDYRVSLKELHRYLTRHVDAWAQANRGLRQLPLLIPEDAGDFILTCSVDRPLLDRMIARFATDAAAESSLPRSQLDELWSVFAELIQHHSDTLAPLEMGDLRRQLVRLEKEAGAGEAYRLEANATEREWRRRAERLRERISRPASDGLASPESRAAYSDVWVPGLAGKLRSLPLLARLGRVEPSVLAGLQADLKRLESAGSLQDLAASLDVPPTNEQTQTLGVVHFLKLLQTSLGKQDDFVPGVGLTGPAFELQVLAEKSSVPGDPRTQSWIRGVIDAADGMRRTAQDKLLAGAFDESLHGPVRQAYLDVSALDSAVADALHLSDEVLAELPDLARWIISARRRESSDAEDVLENLSTVIAGVQSLVRQLDDSPTATSVANAAELPFLAQYNALRLQHSRLRERFDETCERLSARRDADPLVVEEASRLLEVPLLSTHSTENGLTPLQQRQAIQSQYVQLSRDLHRRSMERLLPQHESSTGQVASASTPLERPDSGAPFKSQSSDYRHPLVGLLEPLSQAVDLASAESDRTGDRPAPDAGGSNDEVGAGVRRILKAVPTLIDAAREKHLSSPDQPSREWRRAAGQARLAAPFLMLPGQVDPVAELRRVEIQQILLWHARRYIDDFWGPGRRGEPSYFDSAASAAVEAARLIGIPNPAAAKQISELQSLLALRREAARRGLAVRADPLLLVETGDRPTARVDVALTSAAAKRGIPPGLSTLRIADQQGEMLAPLVPVPVQPEPAPQEPVSEKTQSQEFQVPLAGRRRALADTVGTATVLYRGHEFRDDLLIKTAAGTTVEFRPRKVHTARVRLNGNKRQRPSVVFVLDCSASMRKEMTFESPETKVPRMEVAKAALIRMLNALAARGDARVGVILYGHRVGWSTKEPNQLLTQATYGGPLPQGLKPYEDIETILSLGRFDALAAARVAQRLEKVKPWGETPLYLALTQALLEFKDDDRDAQRSVVVITDGVNYQFNPSPDKVRTAQDVLAANGARGIPLHIVGFGIHADEIDEAQREFGRLSSETGGHYVSVSEATSLAETLEDILQRRQYSVTSLAGSRLQAAIGSPLELQWVGDDAPDFTVSMDQFAEQIELGGGEALELFVSQKGDQLLSAGYDVGSPVFGDLVGGSSHEPSGIRLGVHQPVREENNTVIFDLSLQQAEQRFLRRPREIWIEVTPLKSDNRPAPKYVVYDPQFVLQTPVPVLRVTARNWPKEARKARIDFWCRWSATEPSLVIPLSEIPGPGQPPTTPATLDGISGMKYQVRFASGNPVRVDVIETYASDTAGGAFIKVEIAGPVLPGRALHQFDDANHFATHSFVFENEPANALPLADSLRITSRRRMLDESKHLEIPITIDVPELADTIPSLPPVN